VLTRLRPQGSSRASSSYDFQGHVQKSARIRPIQYICMCTTSQVQPSPTVSLVHHPTLRLAPGLVLLPGGLLQPSACTLLHQVHIAQLQPANLSNASTPAPPHSQLGSWPGAAAWRIVAAICMHITSPTAPCTAAACQHEHASTPAPSYPADWLLAWCCCLREGCDECAVKHLAQHGVSHSTRSQVADVQLQTETTGSSRSTGVD
jgi:hypothetical protein